MTWILDNFDLLTHLLWVHFLMTAPAILAATLIAIPLGYWAHRSPRVAPLVVTGSGLLYAIPSIPLLIILPVIIGTGLRSSLNVVIALTIYGVALLVRPVAEGFGAIPTDVTTSATAQGYSAWRKFFAVQLPLATPSIFSGMRVVAASSVALCTMSAVLGISTLGSLFTDGLARGIHAEIIAGFLLTLLLAGIFDAALTLTGRALTPWTRRST